MSSPTYIVGGNGSKSDDDSEWDDDTPTAINTLAEIVANEQNRKEKLADTQPDFPICDILSPPYTHEVSPPTTPPVAPTLTYPGRRGLFAVRDALFIALVGTILIITIPSAKAIGVAATMGGVTFGLLVLRTHSQNRQPKMLLTTMTSLFVAACAIAATLTLNNHVAPAWNPSHLASYAGLTLNNASTKIIAPIEASQARNDAVTQSGTMQPKPSTPYPERTVVEGHEEPNTEEQLLSTSNANSLLTPSTREQSAHSGSTHSTALSTQPQPDHMAQISAVTTASSHPVSSTYAPPIPTASSEELVEIIADANPSITAIAHVASSEPLDGLALLDPEPRSQPSAAMSNETMTGTDVLDLDLANLPEDKLEDTRPVTRQLQPDNASTTRLMSQSDPLSPTIVDTILRSNRSLKNCFQHEYKRSGTIALPLTVDFQVQNNGRTSQSWVSDAQHKGTELESCLQGALAQVHFPPFEGSSRQKRYTFRM